MGIAVKNSFVACGYFTTNDECTEVGHTFGWYCFQCILKLRLVVQASHDRDSVVGFVGSYEILELPRCKHAMKLQAFLNEFCLLSPGTGFIISMPFSECKI